MRIISLFYRWGSWGPKWKISSIVEQEINGGNILAPPLLYHVAIIVVCISFVMLDCLSLRNLDVRKSIYTNSLRFKR